MPPGNEKALKRLHRELTQYQGESYFDSNSNGLLLKASNRNRNYNSSIREGCRCQSCSDMRYKQDYSFNGKLDFIRSLSKTITSNDIKLNSSEPVKLFENFNQNELTEITEITDDYLFLLGSSWLRFLNAMPKETLNDFSLTDHLKTLKKELQSYPSKNANDSSNTYIFLTENVTAEQVRDDVNIKFTNRYKKKVNDYYKERRYLQIVVIVGIVLFIASIIILAMYGFQAIVLASPLLSLGWIFLFAVGFSFSVLPGLALMTTSIDSFTSTLKENHDTLAQALKEEFSTQEGSFFQSASELIAQIDYPPNEITNRDSKNDELEKVPLLSRG